MQSLSPQYFYSDLWDFFRPKNRLKNHPNETEPPKISSKISSTVSGIHQLTGSKYSSIQCEIDLDQVFRSEQKRQMRLLALCFYYLRSLLELNVFFSQYYSKEPDIVEWMR